jgi:hypothetical protein
VTFTAPRKSKKADLASYATIRTNPVGFDPLKAGKYATFVVNNSAPCTNFGNGHIDAYDPMSGELIDKVRDSHGQAVVIDGL